MNTSLVRSPSAMTVAPAGYIRVSRVASRRASSSAGKPSKMDRWPAWVLRDKGSERVGRLILRPARASRKLTTLDRLALMETSSASRGGHDSRKESNEPPRAADRAGTRDRPEGELAPAPLAAEPPAARAHAGSPARRQPLRHGPAIRAEGPGDERKLRAQ